jgi:hypothetical protein
MTQRKTVMRPKAPARVPVSSEARQALSEIADELAKLSPDQVLNVNVDIARAVSIVLGAEPQIVAYEAQIKEALPTHDFASLARLRTYALAALHAHLDAQPVSTRSELTDLIAQATPLKRTLIVAAESLAHAGLLDGGRLGEIKSGTGHLDLAADLVALGALFEVSWELVEDKTFVAYADVERASRLGTDLLVALGEKNHAASRATPEAVDRKRRAFTLLFRAYDEARRALSYLRWHEDDVDLRVPSLYPRARRKTAARGEPEVEVEVEGEGDEAVEPASTVAGGGERGGEGG